MNLTVDVRHNVTTMPEAKSASMNLNKNPVFICCYDLAKCVLVRSSKRNASNQGFCSVTNTNSL